jgi:uncharacterized protein (DUF2252 family)
MIEARKEFLCAEIAHANAFIVDAAARDEKYHAMQQSPFQFYRAAAHLYYADLGSGVIALPGSWKTREDSKIWLSGDFHTQNIGFSADNAGSVIFDLNDADESYIGPFYWDLIRFSTSLYLFTDALQKAYSHSEQESLVAYFLQTYQDMLQQVSGNRDELRLQVDRSFVQNGFIRDRLRDLQKKTQADLLKRWTIKNESGRRFDLNNVNLAPLSDADKAALVNNWSNYLQSLSPSFVAAQQSQYFNIKDCARRLHSGLGSLGVDKYYVLIAGNHASGKDEQILEVKEQLLPSLFNEGSSSLAQYNAWFASHAQRSVIATKALAIKVDEHLGWYSFNGKAFRVRQLPPSRGNLLFKDFNARSDVKDFVTYAARALALAHARSDRDYNATYVSYSFEQACLAAIAAWPQFKATVNNLSQRYYQQVKADHALFVELLAAGAMAAQG